jgi:putative redox protein
MKVTLDLDSKMKIIGNDGEGHETIFDTPAAGGEFTAATPMNVMLQAMGACSFMDTISILRKKRKDITHLQIKIDGERTDEHPKVFKKVHLHYILTSKDAELNDLERSVELSQDKYCGASAMFRASGCEVTNSVELKRPE